MKPSYVYLHCKPDGTPFYVGKGKGNRAYNLSPKARKNNWHERIVKKYGKENIIIKILCYTWDEAEALRLEQVCIWILRDYLCYVLVNMTDGGEGVSGSHANLGKTSHRKGKHLSIEHCKNISKGLFGNKNVVLGKKRGKYKKSEETIKILEICKKLGLKFETVSSRIRRGWPEQLWFAPIINKNYIATKIKDLSV